MPEQTTTYTLNELNALQPKQIEVLKSLADKTIDCDLDDDEVVAEAFALWAPCEGCVPDGKVGDDGLLGAIRDKFGYLLNVANEFAARELSIEAHQFWVVIDPDYSNDTRVAVLPYENTSPYCYYAEGRKAWRYEFETLAGLADEIIRLVEALIDGYKRTQKQRKNVNTLKSAIDLIDCNCGSYCSSHSETCGCTCTQSELAAMLREIDGTN